MEQMRSVTATVVTRPACRMIIKRGKQAKDYLSYCAEVGCDIWDILSAVPNRLDEAVLVSLPPCMVKPGTSEAVCAVEVPLEGELAVPEGCEVIAMDAHTMLWFQGEPFEDESWYGNAYAEVGRTIEHYRPEWYGYRFAYDLAPIYTFGATARSGCRILIPIVELDSDFE